MSFVDSPRVEYDAEGTPPERGRYRRPFVRVLIIVLLVAAFGVNAVMWIQGNVVHRFTGTSGEIRGQVLIESGEPLADAEVYLATAPKVIAQTDAQGLFDLRNVPTGEQTLIVGYGDRAEEWPIQVSGERVTMVGELVYVTPISDDYWK